MKKIAVVLTMLCFYGCSATDKNISKIDDKNHPKISTYAYGEDIANPQYDNVLTKMDTILSAFIDTQADGHLSSFASGAICSFMQRNPNFKGKFIVSTGGWGTTSFSSAFSSTQNRNNFINDVKKLITTPCSGSDIYPYSGIDIDWEYPVNVYLETPGENSPTTSLDDTQNLHTLVIEMRKSFDNNELSKNAIISLALPHGNQDLDGGSIDNYFKNNKTHEILPDTNAFINSVTNFNLMSYDFMAYTNITVVNAPLTASAQTKQSIQDGVDILTKLGIAKDKIIIGAPLYGRTISGDGAAHSCLSVDPTDINHGLGIPLNANCGTNFISYNDSSIKMDAYDTTYFQDTTLAQSLPKYPANNPALKNYFLSFDSPADVALKADYIKDNDLGGMFFWIVNQDRDYDETGSYLINGISYPHSIIKTAYQHLKN